MQITQKLLHEYFDYDEKRGNLLHKNPRNKSYKGKAAGCIQTNGYKRIKIKGKLYMAHRLIWLYIYGSWPKNDIDHINGNQADNRIENLRNADKKQNTHNQKKQKNNRSGYKGVVTDSRLIGRKKPYRAGIYHNGKSEYLGFFATAEEAAAAYNEAALKYHGEFARLNEIGEVR